MIIATISYHPPSLELLLLLPGRGIRVLELPARERLPVVLVDIIRYHLLPLALPDVYEVIGVLRAILREFGLLILLTLEGVETRGLLPVILVGKRYTIQVEFVLDCLG